MPFYEWDPKTLSVNVTEMDNEHQVLIKKMNAVFDAAKSGADRTSLDAVVSDFASYTISHFKDEEAYMEKMGFPGLATHRLIHKQLIEQVTAHIVEFQSTGKLSEKFFSFLSVWLTSHIRGIDSKYGEFKKAKAS